ncbi:uncharacterized protein LACBIDRAFT_313529 [Laccaria bicolor S238N-H82]|uniref:Predicted protein n=1 Tax=Laccaria bicolor (strain S238N-H82 / ATCC MYA-4686) TaxID=486041 RepID=B0D074_LACBS|nr:uncharacterized protein LACBIDRAFT_313529 [Laccaria bicolor S238N-H82]EDR11779.1 predicted protein [Laccaria bicolor S238N-H82]|eukprot:XP_001877676.1 predicted protein [Laccaria bicolor S238N-H82]
MLCVELVWAFITGWQVMLVGVGLAPVFAACMAVQSCLVAKCEMRNKRAREEVAKGYYETLSNMHGIRCMAFEGIFCSHFNFATDKVLTTGVRGAFVKECTHGLASALIYLAEALLFYIGAILITCGTYTYLQMVEVLNLVVFSVTIGSQLMAFTEKIARSGQAANDFNQLLQLNTTSTDETKGVVHPELAGGIDLNNIHFFYPGRPEVPVLRNVNLSIDDGECITIIGPSGSGKSTLATLLQRLYEPTNGTITIGLNRLCDIEINHLHDHVSVVSQHPNLFDATIAENIRYGNQAISDYDIHHAAKAVQVHDFILSLPQGCHIPLIARALTRPSRILILDECTSSLDGENQAKVLDTIQAAKLGRTTMMVMHKLEVMMMCNRIVVVDGGEVRKQGTYDELM